ncbi:hypothetical protein CVT25_006604 [Psilocybe cyanescens]|uniref:REJ domain-containing protein n=1 Tax=Psilocybe cyanescens TaxID=93625 RepID=A0A409XKP8_PSICY|nr:hypothetical protein CVT25_006604 [Psilocybe cyanescens]
MSAHALLVLHNLAVLDAFFAGVRGVVACSSCSSRSVSFAASSLPSSAPTSTYSSFSSSSLPSASTPIQDETTSA